MSKSTKQQKDLSNTGFDNTTNRSSGRVLGKNGKTNVKKIGISRMSQLSIYHTLIEMPLSHFLILCVLGFIVVNVLFGTLYFFLNPAKIGIDMSHTQGLQFLECIFFSAQTITTVGYGRVNPQSIPTGIIASFEAFIGLLSFAVLTGLIYGRFARPQAFLKFSHHALISPFKEGKALMVRLASYKNNSLTDLEANMIVGMRMKGRESTFVNYYPCKLDIAHITSLALSWTLVHPINDESPLYDLTMQDFEEKQLEILVFIKGFDEHFSNIVKARTSFHYSEVIDNAKFNIMFKQSEDGRTTLLELDKLNDYNILTNPQ